MKKNLIEITSDPATICCSAECASIRLETTAQKALTVEYPADAGVELESADGHLIIKQRLHGLARLFKLSPDAITVRVPEHLVPSVTVTGESARCEIAGGIYAELEYSVKHGGIKIEDAMLGSAAIKGECVTVTLANSTVKGSLICANSNGNVKLENVFATHVDCRVKSGNIGAANLNCRDSAFEAYRGNVTATVVGDESAFGVSVTAKDGTCNRQSVSQEREEARFKAFSAKGNIFVEFVLPEKEASL